MPKNAAEAVYKRRTTRLRDRLLDAQFELKKTQAGGVLLIVTGVPAAGRTETVHELLDWLDQKYISVRAFDPAGKAQGRPPMWRYWQALPARGRVAIHFNGWYSDLLPYPGIKKHTAKRIASRAASIRSLERMLLKDRIAVVKVHLHIAVKLQQQRLKRLRADKLTRWRVTKEDRWQAKHARELNRAFAQCLKSTHHAGAAWHSIDGANEDERMLAVGAALLAGMHKALRCAKAKQRDDWPQSTRKRVTPLASGPPQTWNQDSYAQSLRELQARFAGLTRKPSFQKRALVLAFEGMDAAGKGGAIRRLTTALDVRQFRVVPVSAPTPEELLHPYLWRFWRCIPEPGAVAIFDRSWYGRVLVERVRGLTPKPDWRRAYEEIRDFEAQLTDHRYIVAKFWLSVSKQEQLQRFKARDENPLKRFKVDPEDWKNHRFYDAYQQAAQEMIARTHTVDAPWTVVEADDKKYARLKVLEMVCETIERKLGR